MFLTLWLHAHVIMGCLTIVCTGRGTVGYYAERWSTSTIYQPPHKTPLTMRAARECKGNGPPVGPHGSSWTNQLAEDKVCYENGSRWMHVSGDEWLNRTFHKGFRLMQRRSERLKHISQSVVSHTIKDMSAQKEVVLAEPLPSSEVIKINKNKAMPNDVVSCNKFYAPELALFNLEFGLLPGINFSADRGD